MKPEQLQAIRERVNKATKGNWLWELGTGNIRVRWYESRQPIIAKVLIPEWHENQIMGSVEAANNAEFIAHAREDVPALLDEIERLRGALEWYADKAHWFDGVTSDTESEPPSIYDDQGNRARQALAGESV